MTCGGYKPNFRSRGAKFSLARGCFQNRCTFMEHKLLGCSHKDPVTKEDQWHKQAVKCGQQIRPCDVEYPRLRTNCGHTMLLKCHITDPNSGVLCVVLCVFLSLVWCVVSRFSSVRTLHPPHYTVLLHLCLMGNWPKEWHAPKSCISSLLVGMPPCCWSMWPTHVSPVKEV